MKHIDYDELLPVFSAETVDAETRSEVQTVNTTFSLTAIYGQHGTAGHAHEIAEAVEPHSIVLTEGYMLDRSYTQLRVRQHLDVAAARLASGTYSADHVGDWRRLAAEFLERRHQPAAEPDIYGYTLYTELLSKDCLILPADFLNLSDAVPPMTDLKARQQKLEALFPLQSAADLEAAILLEAELLDRRLQNLTVRETAAVSYTIRLLNLFAGLSDGKIRAYIVYGLAHRHSLTARFEKLGLSVASICINTSGISLDELGDFSKEFSWSADERKAVIINHYLGNLIASSLVLEE